MKLVVVLLALIFVGCASAQRDLAVYLGGEQTPSSGPSGNHLTTFRTETEDWDTFGFGCDGDVFALKVIDGIAYIGGDFLECNSKFVGPMVKYEIATGMYMSVLPEGSTWQYSWDVNQPWNNTTNITAGNTTQVRGDWADIMVKNWQFYKGEFYVVGAFAIDSVSAEGNVSRINNVGVYDPRSNTWRQLGEGLNAPVSSVWVQDSNTIFFGGKFDRSGYPNTTVPADLSGFAVYHENHHTIPNGYSNYQFPGTFPTLDGEILAIWRGVIQTEPNGDRANPPIHTPLAPRFTLIIAGNFTGGVMFQQDDMSSFMLANGGLHGGAVRRIIADLDNNAIYFAGSFSTAGMNSLPVGGFARWNYQNQMPRGGDLWREPYPATYNSNPQPFWDALNGGVSQTGSSNGDVFDMVFDDATGMIYLSGAFDAPYNNVAAYDPVSASYKALGNGNEFSANLYAIALGPYETFYSSWAGVWTDKSWYGGALSCCVSGQSISCSNGPTVFSGLISLGSGRVAGTWHSAGNSQDGSSGTFGLIMDPSGLHFSGWYATNGERGRTPWTEESMTDASAPNGISCAAFDVAAAGTLTGQWQSDSGDLLNICITANSVVASSRDGFYFSGLASAGDKIIQAQWFDGTGYGVSIITQLAADVAVHRWFAGDIRDIDLSSNCLETSSCGSQMLSRRSDVNLTDSACQANSARGVWEGSWAMGRVENLLYIRQTGGTGASGAYGIGIIEGVTDGTSMSGAWIEGGWDEVSGPLRGVFSIALEPRAEGRVFSGTFSFTRDIDGNLLVDQEGNPAPIDIYWASQRQSHLTPSAQNSMLPSSTAGPTITGTWMKPDGSELSLCIVPRGASNEPEVVGTSGSRFYAGDPYSISGSDGVQLHSTQKLATLSWWDEDTYGWSIIRRITATQIQESWAEGNPLTFKRSLCSSETCQFPDSGTGQVIYNYVSQPTLNQCQAAKESSSYDQPNLN